VRAGVDVVVASAGVGGDLQIINDELALGGQASLGLAAAKPTFKIHVYCTNNLTLLKGKIFLFAKVGVKVLGHFIGKEYDFTIYEFPGFKFNGNLFNETKSIAL